MSKRFKSAKSPDEARATPGLKLLTPLESQMIQRVTIQDRERWKHLFSLNKWRLIK
jgi:hypothetical protein